MDAFRREDYASEVDGRADWYLFRPGAAGDVGLVVLHGHGAHGDQLLARPDLRAGWLPALLDSGADLLSPNLRDNAWMSPPAAADLARLVREMKAARQWRRVIFAGGSMGGTGALIFAVRYPELADGLVVLGAATSLRRYRDWCAAQSLPILAEIGAALDAAYTEAEYDAHDVCRHAERLNMPIEFHHGADDAVMPVGEARALAARLSGRPAFRYTEIPGGGHDAPLAFLAEGLARIVKQVHP